MDVLFKAYSRDSRHLNHVYSTTQTCTARCLIFQGRKGLYAGMATHVARVVPNTAIMFLSYGWCPTQQGWTGGEGLGPVETYDSSGCLDEPHFEHP